jgi:integration host factor subunit beta
VLDQLGEALARGERIEVRGFGSFSLRYRRARLGPNPKTRSTVALAGWYAPHFEPGVELLERVNGHLSE